MKRLPRRSRIGIVNIIHEPALIRLPARVTEPLNRPPLQLMRILSPILELPALNVLTKVGRRQLLPRLQDAHFQSGLSQLHRGQAAGSPRSDYDGVENV